MLRHVSLGENAPIVFLLQFYFIHPTTSNRKAIPRAKITLEQLPLSRISAMVVVISRSPDVLVMGDVVDLDRTLVILASAPRVIVI